MGLNATTYDTRNIVTGVNVTISESPESHALLVSYTARNGSTYHAHLSSEDIENEEVNNYGTSVTSSVDVAQEDSDYSAIMF